MNARFSTSIFFMVIDDKKSFEIEEEICKFNFI